uniref:C40 family peptidase n=1 Tax=Deinococcus sp. TaxID=47478 RepID=UPI0025BFE5CF
MNKEELDPRVLAFDEGRRLAETSAQGQLSDCAGGGWRYITPQPLVNGVARLSLRARPDDGAAQVTEALVGEALELLWEQGDWARVRTVHDRYLGWVKAAALQTGQAPAAAQTTDAQTTDTQTTDAQSTRPEMTVTALRAHAFAGPKVSRAIVAELSLGARVWQGAGEVVEEDGRRWVPVLLPGGQAAYVQEVCFTPLAGTDPAAFALRFLETPYVWGGRSAWGLDCSGLTQVVYGAFGVNLPRDADQQQAALTAVSGPRAGDLAFFPGHVGLMLDEKRMVHAAEGRRLNAVAADRPASLPASQPASQPSSHPPHEIRKKRQKTKK